MPASHLFSIIAKPIQGYDEPLAAFAQSRASAASTEARLAGFKVFEESCWAIRAGNRENYLAHIRAVDQLLGVKE